jgi:hypothetical protein
MSPTTQDLVTVAGNQASVQSTQPSAGDSLYNSYVAMGVEPANAAAMAQIAVPSFQPPAEAMAPSGGGWTPAGTYSGPSSQSGIPTQPGGAITGGAANVLGVPEGTLSSTPEQYLQILQKQAKPPLTGPIGGAIGGAGGPIGGAGTNGLNIPYGADFYGPMLQYLMGMLGIGEDKRQFNATQLAAMQANPFSASELAFRRAGQGLSPFATGKTNAADVRDMIASPTSTGMPGGNSVDFGGGQVFNVPDTLSGGQMSNLQGMPGSQGVLESIARAAGNPDIIARSLKALLPSGFGATGTGLA